MINRIIPAGAAFYPFRIDYALRLNRQGSAYLERLHDSSQDNGRKFTFSVWLKRYNISVASNGLGILSTFPSSGSGDAIVIDSNDRLQVYYNGQMEGNLVTTMKLRDPTHWYHIVVVYDTAQATASNRVKIYVNGIQVTDFDTETYPVQYRYTLHLKWGESDEIGSDDSYLAASLAEVHCLDNQALAPSDFGELKNGVWVPKKYTGGSYGSNGFYLDFADSASLGKDVSGNSNNFNVGNIDSADQVTDTPTENHPILSDIERHNASLTIEDGGLVLDTALTNDWETAFATLVCPIQGKWYWEVKADAVASNGVTVGLCSNDNKGSVWNDYVGATGRSYGYRADGNKYNNGSGVAYGATYSAGDVIGVAYDADNGTLRFYKNGSDQGQAHSGLTPSFSGEGFLPAISLYTTGNDITVNFGQRPFAYSPPTGFKALCTTHISNAIGYGSRIMKPYEGFDIAPYTGNGAVRSIGGINFQSDLVWIKNRDQADEHKLVDSVRGATKELSSDSANVEQTDANGLTAFNVDGFSLGTGANGYNDNLEKFVAWCFRKLAQYGIDIVAYTGTGVAHTENHSLGAVPELIIIKNRGVARNWTVYHHHALNTTDPETDYGCLDLTNAWNDLNTIWNDTAPTATQFTLGTAAAVNENTKDFIAYLFRSIEGFSKVFSYEGNGNADGPFIHLGFRPKFILIKNADVAARNWTIIDGGRDTYNICKKRLFPDLTNAENTGTDILDIASNGFKIRNTTADVNENNQTIVGIAFTEMPGVFANAA